MAIAYGYQLYAHRRATRPQVWIDGLPLESICTFGSLRTSTRLNGDWQASWRIRSLRTREFLRHPAFHQSAPVEVKLGPIVCWAGYFPEQDWTTGEMVALGSPREAEDALCFTEDEQTTTKPNVAIDSAILRGVVNWVRRHDFGAARVGKDDDTAPTFSQLAQLLDARCEEIGDGIQWRIDRRRGLVLYTPDETAPEYLIIPGTDDMGVAGDERVDRFFTRYSDSTDGGALKTASYPALTPVGGREKGASLLNRGEISPTRAGKVTRSVWSKLAGRTGWTNGVNLTTGQITTMGDTPAELGLVRAGQAARRLGAPDPRSLAKHTDFVIGETEFDWDEEKLQINPVGMVSFNRVLEDTSPGAVPLD